MALCEKGAVQTRSRGPSLASMEVSLVRTQDMGFSLAEPIEGYAGALVMAVSPEASSKGLRTGYLLREVSTSSGARSVADDYSEIVRFLRTAEQGATLVLGLVEAPLPNGWTQLVDEVGEALFVHAKRKLQSSEHPLAHRDTGASPGTRGRGTKRF